MGESTEDRIPAAESDTPRAPCSELWLAVAGAAVPPVDERAALVAEVVGSVSAPGGRALLIGEPGVGRSTVLTQVVGQLEAAGTRVLRTRALSADEPFGGLLDLLSGVDDAELAPLPMTQRRILESWRSSGSRRVDVSERMALRLAIASVARVLRRHGPLVMAVDDWMNLDPESVGVLGYLHSPTRTGWDSSLVATQVVDSRLSGRQPVVDHAIFRPGTVHVVAPLNVRSLGVVLAEWRGQTLSPEQLAHVHGTVGGNPSWAMELLDQPLRLLQAPDSGPALPNSVAELVVTRVGRLTQPIQRVLAACAVTKGASTKAIVELSETDVATVVAASEQGVVAWRDDQLVAAHPLLGAAATRVLGLRAQLDMHARAADAARGLGERACQLDQAVPPGPDCAVADALGAASAEAWAAGAVAPALAHASRALARSAPGSAARARRAVMMAEVAVAAGWFDRAATVLADLDLPHVDVDLLDRALPLLVDATAATGGDRSVERALTGLAALTGQDGLRRAMVDAHRTLRGEPAADRARRASHALTLLAETADAPRTEHLALASLLVARVDAGLGLDRAVLTRMRALESRVPELALGDVADATEGVHAYQLGDLAVSRSLLTDLVERADDSGNAAAAGEFRVHLAQVELLAGRQARAAALLQWSDGGDPCGPTWPAVVRARGSLAIARDDQAAVDALLALPLPPADPDAGRLALLAVRGSRAAARERWADALPALSEAVSLAAERGVDEPGRRLWLDTMLGTGLVAVGRLVEADCVASRLEAVATFGERPSLRGHALRLRGLVSAASGDLATAEDRLRRATQLIGDGETPADHARCLLELARVLRRRRARSETRRTLLEAKAIAQRIGDRPLLALVERELTSFGRSGTSETLTAAERRVADAAVRGLSNREIAGECFVTVRTVETQLTSVYRKLGVRSRTQLAARLTTDASGSLEVGERRLPVR